MKIQKYIVALVLTVCLYALLVVSVYLLQSYIVFQPTTIPDKYTFSFDESFEEITLSSKDSTAINSLFFPTKEKSKGAILYLHGNADDLRRWGKYAVDFTERGYDVFIIDYRGYGKSEGTLDEKGMYQDVLTAFEWLNEKYSSDQIIIYGRSLGAAMASELASEVNAKMLVLETPFSNVNDLFKNRIALFYLPFDLKYRFANDRNLPNVKYPIHIIHGTDDGVVPLENALKLKPLLREKDSFTIVEEGAHKDLSSFEEYQEWLTKLLE